MTLITMSSKELDRFAVITRLISQQINGTEAAKQLDLSIRQTKRLKARVRKSGAPGLIHGNRGKAGNRKTKPEKTNRIIAIIKSEYPDFGPTLAQEKLNENHQINIGVETLRQLMINRGLRQVRPRKTKKNCHYWRPRKDNYVEMMQFDGSYHDWFEGRTPACCLLAAIDDATGQITQAEFAEDEGIFPVFNFWQEYARTKGKPVSIYLDKFSTYKINHPAAKDNSELLTQFQRAAKTLGIELISANSPQAKGRIERLFGTLQDRLVKEMRIRGINDIKTANNFLNQKFIPGFNAKFSVKSAKKADLHRRLNRIDKDGLESIFSVHSAREINNDYTVRFKNQWLQLLPTQPTTVCRRDDVIIEERPDSMLKISFRGQYLNFIILPKRPEKVKMRVIALTSNKPAWKPPINHPWRQPYSIEKAKLQKQV